jgi:hypothetical protein
MTVENGIIGGLAFVSFIFAYLGFELRENDTVFNQFVSILFFSISLLFTNLLVYTILLVVQNNPSLSYLSSPIGNIALNIIMWVTIIVFFFYFIFTLIKYLGLLYEYLMTIVNNKRGMQ